MGCIPLKQQERHGHSAAQSLAGLADSPSTHFDPQFHYYESGAEFRTPEAKSKNTDEKEDSEKE